jgi:two-component system probable response regulator PhcQ
MPQTVLLVDDDMAVLQALVRRLRKEPYEIRTATSAEEAMCTFERCPIDLVVSDWRMPGMTGTEFLTKVASEYPDCIRIMLTGEASLPMAIGAVNNGEVYRFLTKPYDADALAGIIRGAFQERGDSSLARRDRHEAENDATAVNDTKRQSNEGRWFHHTLIEHVQDAVIAVDHTGIVLVFNAAAERIFRCSRATVLGRPVARLLPTGRLSDMLTGCLASPPSATGKDGPEEPRLETTAVLSDGSAVTVEVETITDWNSGQPILTSFIRDMSTIRSLEAALQAAETQLRQTDELESSRRLSVSVATDVDKLLTAISGYCETLLADVKVTGAARESVRQIKRIGARSAALTRQLLGSGGKAKTAPGDTPKGTGQSADSPAAKPAARSIPLTNERR